MRARLPAVVRNQPVHNILVNFDFPFFDELFPQTGLENHDICIKQGNKTMRVTVLDTCGDSDCDGCCTENRGNADRLIDLEKYTNERWGLDDGAIQWADIGPNATSCN